MKPKVFNTFLLVAYLFTLPSIAFSTGCKEDLRRTEYKKKVEKKFSVGLSDKFIVANKYGEINLTTWDKAEVSIVVDITVNARSQDAANATFDRIKINFDQGSGYTSAKTELESKSSGWGSWWGSNNSDDFKINYTINMPTGHTLDLSNKYGHSHVAAFNGDGKFAVKYGDLFTQAVGGDVDLYLGYGNATIGNCKDVKAEIKYSKLRMEDMADLDLNCKYSKIYFNSAEDLKLYSGYDDFEIGTLRSISYETKYSDLDINDVQDVKGYSKYTNIDIQVCRKKAIMELSYGSLKIGELKSGFEEVDVKTNYASVKMQVDPSANYDFSASTRYAGIDYPSGLDVRRDIQSGSSKEVSGHKGASGGGSIKISTNYGGVKVW